MRPRTLLIIGFVLAVPGLAQAGQRHEWLRYTVCGTSLSVGIPTAIFTEDAGPAPDGIGRRFTSPDGSADLTVAAIANDNDASPAEFLAARNPPSDMSYRRVTRRFFAISSVRNGRIWYNRCNRADGAMNCVLINYPESEKSRWDDIVTRISRSLSWGT